MRMEGKVKFFPGIIEEKFKGNKLNPNHYDLNTHCMACVHVPLPNHEGKGNGKTEKEGEGDVCP